MSVTRLLLLTAWGGHRLPADTLKEPDAHGRGRPRHATPSRKPPAWGYEPVLTSTVDESLAGERWRRALMSTILGACGSSAAPASRAGADGRGDGGHAVRERR